MRRTSAENRAGSPTQGKDESGQDREQEQQSVVPFQNALKLDTALAMSPESIVDRFRTHGLLWIRGDGKQPTDQHKAVLDLLRKHKAVCSSRFTVENRGAYDHDMEFTEIFPNDDKDGTTDRTMPKESFYVSTILHRSDSEALTELLDCLPDNPIEESFSCNGGAWLFVGRHHNGANQNDSNSSDTADDSTGTGASNDNNNKSSNKRKRPLMGRAEHVDDVTHSGTWHYQLAGTKTWWIRPHRSLWDCDVPDLSILSEAEQTQGGGWRLPIHTEQGDWFVLNTRIWYHCTEVEGGNDWSISVARDFYLPLRCPRDVDDGEVVLEEDEIPLDLPRGDDPNCTMAEIEDEKTGQASIVLAAVKAIPKGAALVVATGDENELSGMTDEANDNECVDPRVVAKRDCGVGEVVLENDDIPDELPRSMEPNCRLFVENDSVVLETIEAVPEGGVFCILPDDDEEYEEVEVDLGTGELHHLKE